MNTLLKWVFILAAVLFADWIIMILAGCFSGFCRADDHFFCTVYCYFGITLLSVSVVLTAYWLLKKKNRQQKNEVPISE